MLLRWHNYLNGNFKLFQSVYKQPSFKKECRCNTIFRSFYATLTPFCEGQITVSKRTEIKFLPSSVKYTSVKQCGWMEISPCPTCLILIKVINDDEIQILGGSPPSRFQSLKLLNDGTQNCLFKPTSSFMIFNLKVTTSFKIMTGTLLAGLFLTLSDECEVTGGRSHLNSLEKNPMWELRWIKVWPYSKKGLKVEVCLH